MNSYINYILEANICLLVLGLFYYLVLKNDTHFRFSRYYLTGTALLALILPLLHFDNPFAGENAVPIVSDLQALTLPELVIGVQNNSTPEASTSGISWIMWAGFGYLSVVIVLLTVFLYQLFQIFQFRQLKKKAITKTEGYLLIPTDGQLPTFSFFNMLFFDNTALLSDLEKKRVIDHEIVHIKQGHTWDVLVMELVKIIFWINPVTWWMKQSIQNVHEYLADQSVLQSTDEQQYSSLLAKMALKQMSLSIGHHFNRSITLKRIKMMKAPKTKLQTWKWVSLIPIILLIVTVFSCNDEVMQDVNDVMETASQTTLPAELEPELDRLQKQYPKADFVYIETDGTTQKELQKLKNLDPNTIAYIKVWKERERIGIIVNKSGPLKNFVNADSDEAFTIVEEPAMPQGGYEEMYRKLAEVLKYPQKARQAGIEGKVYIQFIVDTDGSLTNIEAVKSPDQTLSQAAIAAMETIEPFKPASQRGKLVKQRIVLPITFSLGNEAAKIAVDKAQDSPDSRMTIQTKRDGLSITGIITRPDGKPMPGVNIVIKGTHVGTVSDINGNFKITAFDHTDVLVFSFIGFETKNLPLDDC
ncbi:TonB [Fulvivirga imtechensis AK7]|uniref:TonB n=1 Tax=Fulvivirga imtechensis AK7 TaxID=1237149 RepID=L8K0Q2_9BACT|nr:M56 family metallopeptidase [Fulvivirga imtechensis]ELR73504.1 TonB [Fulvivirga imtechensis AK7]